MKANTSMNELTLSDWCSAVSEDIQQLAILHDKEAGQTLISALRGVNFPSNLALSIVSEFSSNDEISKNDPASLVTSALTTFPEEIDQSVLDILAADYAEIYLLHGLHASPYESVWLDEDHLIQQEPMFKIRECYKRYGLASSDWRVRSEDHLVLQLQFIALLLDSESDFPNEATLKERVDDAVHFMDKHLLLWISDFCALVNQRCDTDFYASIAIFTNAYLVHFRNVLTEITGIPTPSTEEIDKILNTNHAQNEKPIAFMPGVAESW